ncbi:MAG TPA: DUF6798 domain-containing protein [Polyangiales bacterium]|nr:DUF6798 domain-containing protein [Polyangiales bacterium]
MGQVRDGLSSWLVQALLFACVSAALILWQVGYGFEVGDQLQYLLLPYREIYPEFLPGDWFTWQTSHYHATFAWVVRGLAGAFGVEQLPQSVFALHVLSSALFGFALLRLSHALGFGLFEAAFALCGFALVRQMGLAGSVLNHGALVPADLALPCFVLACAAHARGAVIAMGVWLGVAGFMHANYAVLGPAVLFPLELWRWYEQRTSRLPLLAAVAIYALLASPNLRVVLGSFLIRDAAPEAVAVTLFTRSPHHYDLRSMRLDELYYAFGLCLLTSPLSLGRLGPPAQRVLFLRLTGALVFLIAVSALGSLFHIVALSRLFTWRLSIPLFALWLLAAGAALSELAAQRNWWQVLWLLALCAGLTAFAQTDPLEQSPWNTVTRAPGLCAGLACVATVLALVRWQRMAAALQGLGALLAVAAAVVALSVTHSAFWQGTAFKPPRGLHFLDGRIELNAPERALYQAVRAQTPSDARILIPPGMNQFRMGARRSVFVDWKCAPMRGDEALEWQRRMLAAMGTTSFPAQGYALVRAADAAYLARPLTDLVALARREKLSHVLARSSYALPPGTKRILQNGRFTLYELAP